MGTPREFRERFKHVAGGGEVVREDIWTLPKIGPAPIVATGMMTCEAKVAGPIPKVSIRVMVVIPNVAAEG